MLFTPRTTQPAQQSVSYVSNVPITVSLAELQFRKVSGKLVKWSAAEINNAGTFLGGFFLILCLFVSESWGNAGTVRSGKGLSPLAVILTVWFFGMRVKKVLSFYLESKLKWENWIWTYVCPYKYGLLYMTYTYMPVVYHTAQKRRHANEISGLFCLLFSSCSSTWLACCSKSALKTISLVSMWGFLWAHNSLKTESVLARSFLHNVTSTWGGLAVCLNAEAGGSQEGWGLT